MQFDLQIFNIVYPCKYNRLKGIVFSLLPSEIFLPQQA